MPGGSQYVTCLTTDSSTWLISAYGNMRITVVTDFLNQSITTGRMTMFPDVPGIFTDGDAPGVVKNNNGATILGTDWDNAYKAYGSTSSYMSNYHSFAPGNCLAVSVGKISQYDLFYNVGYNNPSYICFNMTQAETLLIRAQLEQPVIVSVTLPRMVVANSTTTLNCTQVAHLGGLRAPLRATCASVGNLGFVYADVMATAAMAVAAAALGMAIYAVVQVNRLLARVDDLIEQVIRLATETKEQFAVVFERLRAVDQKIAALQMDVNFRSISQAYYQANINSFFALQLDVVNQNSYALANFASCQAKLAAVQQFLFAYAGIAAGNPDRGSLHLAQLVSTAVMELRNLHPNEVVNFGTNGTQFATPSLVVLGEVVHIIISVPICTGSYPTARVSRLGVVLTAGLMSQQPELAETWYCYNKTETLLSNSTKVNNQTHYYNQSYGLTTYRSQHASGVCRGVQPTQTEMLTTWSDCISPGGPIESAFGSDNVTFLVVNDTMYPLLDDKRTSYALRISGCDFLVGCEGVLSRTGGNDYCSNCSLLIHVTTTSTLFCSNTTHARAVVLQCAIGTPAAAATGILSNTVLPWSLAQFETYATFKPPQGNTGIPQQMTHFKEFDTSLQEQLHEDERISNENFDSIIKSLEGLRDSDSCSLDDFAGCSGPMKAMWIFIIITMVIVGLIVLAKIWTKCGPKSRRSDMAKLAMMTFMLIASTDAAMIELPKVPKILEVEPSGDANLFSCCNAFCISCCSGMGSLGVAVFWIAFLVGVPFMFWAAFIVVDIWQAYREQSPGAGVAESIFQMSQPGLRNIHDQIKRRVTVGTAKPIWVAGADNSVAKLAVVSAICLLPTASATECDGLSASGCSVSVSASTIMLWFAAGAFWAYAFSNFLLFLRRFIRVIYNSTFVNTKLIAILAFMRTWSPVEACTVGDYTGCGPAERAVFTSAWVMVALAFVGLGVVVVSYIMSLRTIKPPMPSQELESLVNRYGKNARVVITINPDEKTS